MVSTGIKFHSISSLCNLCLSQNVVLKLILKCYSVAEVYFANEFLFTENCVTFSGGVKILIQRSWNVFPRLQSLNFEFLSRWPFLFIYIYLHSFLRILILSSLIHYVDAVLFSKRVEFLSRKVFNESSFTEQFQFNTR